MTKGPWPWLGPTAYRRVLRQRECRQRQAHPAWIKASRFCKAPSCSTGFCARPRCFQA
ncbi:hypothetical protein COCCADRAFT_94315 [Bipolaris zeicola 26-R-13]|uniref:Uncharacterized protein n=1 Tax=Cochliobolus carbonum (strain 26-R-13) TaxID=930089 RepID=W6YF45_COCC2|nr:uncharacterized protein COCCADRAFT_94315 [Bipolaris zeicola 26-R-13]EUC34104.1 hypothetical protein COCCADRAFT_94315 [Bipolaris zeicola 26-R-13]